MPKIYTISCKKENLKEIREFVQKTLNSLGFSEIEANQAILAVDEVCANIIIHSNRENVNASLKVQISQNNEQIFFEITDPQPSFFDFESYKSSDNQALIKEKRKGGMGLKLVHTIMDEVKLVKNETFTIWQLIKNKNDVNKLYVVNNKD
jgi:serine/threonine-protein kinase RsbW